MWLKFSVHVDHTICMIISNTLTHIPSPLVLTTTPIIPTIPVIPTTPSTPPTYTSPCKQVLISAVGQEFNFLDEFEYKYDSSSESETPGPFSRSFQALDAEYKEERLEYPYEYT